MIVCLIPDGCVAMERLLDKNRVLIVNTFLHKQSEAWEGSQRRNGGDKGDRR